MLITISNDCCETFLTFECYSVYREVVEALEKRQRKKVYGILIVGCWLLVVRVVVS